MLAAISKTSQPSLLDLTQKQSGGVVEQQLLDALLGGRRSGLFQIQFKPRKISVFLTHRGGGQGLTPNKLCRAHAPQEVTKLPSRCQMDSTEIQAAK